MPADFTFHPWQRAGYDVLIKDVCSNVTRDFITILCGYIKCNKCNKYVLRN